MSWCMGLKLDLQLDLKAVNCVSEQALPVHLFRHICCKMYHLATMHSKVDQYGA